MRQIKYILIAENPADESSARSLCNLGYHYVVNSEGLVFTPTDIHQPGMFLPIKGHEVEKLNRCSIGVLYNHSLQPSPATQRQREILKDVLEDLRNQFPTAKILGVSEYDEHFIRVNPEMNRLRMELSDLP